MGQQLHRYENLLNRDFTAQRPNQKWVIDISYIHTAQGVLYLSIIRDLFDNSIVAYKTRTDQSVGLVLDTIRDALRKEKAAGELQLHSDQGFQYTSHAYFSLTKEYGMIPHVKTGKLLREPAPLGTMPWLRISFPFSSRNVSIATSFPLFLRHVLSSTSSFGFTTTSAFNSVKTTGSTGGLLHP